MKWKSHLVFVLNLSLEYQKNDKKMKKFTLVLFAVILGTVSTFATNPKKLTLEEKIRTEIKKLLVYPEFSVENSVISAKVEFMLNQKGEIVVLLVESNNKKIDDFIKSRLNYKLIKHTAVEKRNRKFTIPVKIVKK